uniref:Uncharacterized protein n=1 Tax=Capra hircus TaxID=9925 RepID=A0A8C2N9M2_CAPHI
LVTGEEENASGDHGVSVSLGAIKPACSNSSIPQSFRVHTEEPFATYFDEKIAVPEEKVRETWTHPCPTSEPFVLMKLILLLFM